MRPSFVIRDGEREQLTVSLVLSQELTMVLITLLCIIISTEALLFGIIILMNRPTCPSVTLNTEMVIPFLHQFTVSSTAFQDSLRQCDTGWNLVTQHLLDRHVAILVDICLVTLVPFLLLGNNRNRARHEKQEQYIP